MAISDDLLLPEGVREKVEEARKERGPGAKGQETD
jgi:hypothetical protein